RIGNECGLLNGFVPVVLFDGFADSWQRFGAVTRVKTGRIERMLEPGTPRKAAIADQGEFDLPKRIVESLLCIAGSQTRSRRGLPHGSIVAAGALLQARQRILKRREV